MGAAANSAIPIQHFPGWFFLLSFFTCFNCFSCWSFTLFFGRMTQIRALSGQTTSSDPDNMQIVLFCVATVNRLTCLARKMKALVLHFKLLLARTPESGPFFLAQGTWVISTDSEWISCAAVPSRRPRGFYFPAPARVPPHNCHYITGLWIVKGELK